MNRFKSTLPSIVTLVAVLAVIAVLLALPAFQPATAAENDWLPWVFRARSPAISL